MLKEEVQKDVDKMQEKIIERVMDIKDCILLRRIYRFVMHIYIYRT